jgi:ADP-ribosylglycohydrolase
MSLFTANGVLVADTRVSIRGIGGIPHNYLPLSYRDWLYTQKMSFEESRKYKHRFSSWISHIPGLYSRRAPGITCLSALEEKETGSIENPINDSKGCGGIMRVAPLGLMNYNIGLKDLDREGARIAALTHGHSLGYMPAAVLVHIIHRIVFGEAELSLKDIVIEARDTVREEFAGDIHLKELTDMIDIAVDLSENGDSDLDNIHRIGQGWVAEETLGIGIYCSLKYKDDFSAGIIVAVNHQGDSDSTGAVTGNILGAVCGYRRMDEKWKTHLELADVILEMADDLCHGCQMDGDSVYKDPDWIRKYMYN